jgi:hypothetical protein
MRPTPYLPKENFYPLLVGLFVLLLPYLWTIFVLPIRLSHYLRENSVAEETAIEVEPTTSIQTLGTTSSIASTSKRGGLNIWKGFTELVGPKWEDPPEADFTPTTTPRQVAGKTIRTTTTTTKFKTVTTPSVTTVHNHKTITVTRSVTEVESFTETERETVEVIVEKVIQTPAPAVTVEKVKLDENRFVLDEIDVMGWHQVVSIRQR